MYHRGGLLACILTITAPWIAAAIDCKGEVAVDVHFHFTWNTANETFPTGATFNEVACTVADRPFLFIPGAPPSRILQEYAEVGTALVKEDDEPGLQYLWPNGPSSLPLTTGKLIALDLTIDPSIAKYIGCVGKLFPSPGSWPTSKFTSFGHHDPCESSFHCHLRNLYSND